MTLSSSGTLYNNANSTITVSIPNTSPKVLSNLVMNTVTPGSNISLNVVIANTVKFSDNTTQTTAYTGTANNSTNFGGLSLATIQSQITGNAATAYSNAVASIGAGAGGVNTAAQYTFTNTVSFTQTINGTANSANYIGTLSAANVVSNAQLSANLSNYQTTSGLSANVATLTSNNSTNFGGSSLATIQSQITGNAATAYSNAVANAAALYQTTAGLSANVATLTSNNSSFLGGTAAGSYALLSGATFSGAVSGITTLAAGNTTITGSANIVSDSATIQVGNSTSYFSGNTTGFYPVSNTLGNALGNTTSRWALNATTYSGSGTFTLASATGTFGSALTAATYSIGSGATTTGLLKTINIGTSGAAGSNTVITVGSSVAGSMSNTTFYGQHVLNPLGGNATAWSTGGIGLIQSAATFTDNSSATSAVVINAYMNYFATQTYASANTISITSLYGTYFSDPANGTNVTTTTKYAIGGDSLRVVGASVLAGATTLAGVVSFSTATQNINAIALTTGSINLGGVGQSGSITVGNSTNTQILGIATGNTNSANTKTVNIGTGGVSGSQTNITLGSSSSNTLLTINANNSLFSGSINAAAYSVGTSFVANAIQVTLSGIPLNANGSTGTSGQVLTSNGASGAPYWSSGSVNTDAQYTFTNTISFSNTISFTQTINGTANNATNFGGLSLTTVQSQITGNAATAFANAIANAASNAAGIYQTTAGLSANVATLTSNNSTNFNSQPASYYTNATNITTGTLPWAQAPANTVNTSGNFTISGVYTLSSNMTFNSTGALLLNTGSKIYDSLGLQGSAGQVLTSNGAGNVYWSTVSGGGGGVNTANQYVWSNTQTFSANVVINGVLQSGVVTINAASNATITPVASNTNHNNIYNINATPTINQPSGAPYADAQKLMLRLKDSGVANTLTWNVSAGSNSSTTAGFRPMATSNVALPSATIAGKVTYVACVYNALDFYWDVVGVSNQ